MIVNKMTIRIGGEAGDGLESSGAGFCQALTRGGLYVFGLPDYHSRIRGGHNFFSVRVSDKPLYSAEEPVHVLIALTEETVANHRADVVDDGVIIYDSSIMIADELLTKGSARFIAVPLSEIAEQQAGKVIARNTVSLGFIAGLTGFDLEPINRVIRDNFARKGQKIVDGNLAAAEAGRVEGTKYAADFAYKLKAVPDAPRRMTVNGTQAFALGALAGGCRFVSGYPMTPGSPVLHWMAAHAVDYGVVIKHTEDELAAINMAIGAGHMGARALVPTSGGGFSLMTEALGLAGITETPIVVYNAQRPGPATGLPTRQEQGDMLFMLHASQGEFPRFLLTPNSHEECFRAGWRAFNLADRYQTPALVLSDHYLVGATRTVELDAFDYDEVELDRGALLSDADLNALSEPYLRYRITESGVSPRTTPGHPNAVWVAAGNEHDERGAITEKANMRTAQVDKRLRKLNGMAQEISAPVTYGPAEAEITFVGWGSTYGALRETVDRLNAQQVNMANLINYIDLWPFPAEATVELLNAAKRAVLVENNATAQLGTLIRANTGFEFEEKMLRYDGRAFNPDYILRANRE